MDAMKEFQIRTDNREAMMQFRVRDYSGRPAVQRYGETLTGRMAWLWAAWL